MSTPRTSSSAPLIVLMACLLALVGTLVAVLTRDDMSPIWYIVIIAAELVVVVLIGAYIRTSQKHSTD